MAAAVLVVTLTCAPGAASSAAPDRAFFTTHGHELWVTDGTPAGTHLAEDLYSGPFNDPAPSLVPLLAHEGRLFLRAHDGDGSELWVSDGTAGGTFEVADINPTGSSDPGSLAVLDDWIYFSADDGVHGRELWRTDGTAGGTSLVQDVNPGPPSADVDGLTRLGDHLLFGAKTPKAGAELWRTDGTGPGTVRLKDVNPGPDGSSVEGFGRLRGRLYFSAVGPDVGRELWRTDGTRRGTARVADLDPGPGSSDPNGYFRLDDVLYFRARDASAGTELWRSDGTAEGTWRVKDITPGPGSSDPRDLTRYAGELHFSAGNTHWMHTNRELYATDGTADGTRRLFDLNPGVESGNPRFLRRFGTGLLFVGNDGTLGSALYRWDGSDPQLVTQSLGDCWCAPAVVGPVVGGVLLYQGVESEHGYEPWTSGGTPQSNNLLVDTAPGTTSGVPEWFVLVPGG